MASSQPDAPPAGSGLTPIIEFIAKLPSELSGAIFSHLPNSELKKLRLVSKRFADVASPHLRFKRVFISANPRNIEVFRAIANHETFRHDVGEIVWDDACFREPLGEDSGYNGESRVLDYDYDYEVEDSPLPSGSQAVPSWFTQACEENTEYLSYRRGRDRESLPQHVETAQQLAAQLPLDVAYDYYHGLFQQQEDVIASAADEAAFTWALDNDRFPNLRRVTLTPAAHGILFTPLYPTPMIRSFPYGFNYPLPRGWPTPLDGARIGAEYWEDETSRNKWRGFRIVTRVLARQQRTKASEMIVDGSQINSGLTCWIFEGQEPCEDYDNLVAVVKKPGFSTLKLNLMVGGQDWRSYPAFRNGRLKEVLTADLRDVTLETDEDENNDESPAQPRPRPDRFIPLRSIFPVESWTHLRHFGLSRFLVKQQDLLDFLAVLPYTLCSVELSYLWFLNDSGNYRDLLTGIRDDLGWRERSIKPKVTIRDKSSARMVGRGVCVDREVQEFLYGSGDNPYLRSPVGNWVQLGVGIEQDVFEPRFERPYGYAAELRHLGIR